MLAPLGHGCLGEAARCSGRTRPLEKEPVATSGDTWVYVGVVRSLATRGNGDGAAAVRLHEELLRRLGNPTMFGLISSSVAESLGVQTCDEAAAAAPAEAVQALARASDLFRALDRPLHVSPALCASVERELGGASPADLHSLCVGGLRLGRPGLTYAASGEGLAGDGRLLHRFLLARGRALSAAAARRDRDRAVPCLCAARELAGRARDTDAVREASSAIDALTRMPDLMPWADPPPVADQAPPTAEEIARIIGTERARRQPPPFTSEKAGRKRHRARHRQQGDLFDDVLAFLDKHL